ncbi:MAG TPA: hypothetical protein VF746_24540 [Longimicrobium sp.]|jgi:hypothetical protein
MEKLRLDLDELAVESFATERADAGEGTVLAHQNTINHGHSCQRTPCCPDTFQVTCTCA